MTTTPPTSSPSKTTGLPAAADPTPRRSHENTGESNFRSDVASPDLSNPSRSQTGQRNGKLTAVQDGEPNEQMATPATLHAGANEEFMDDSDLGMFVDPKEPLEDFDWEEFEGRYRISMAKHAQIEDDLAKEFHDLVELSSVWSQAGTSHEDDRAIKRCIWSLKTRISYVRGSEQQLEEKNQHYKKVVLAFQNALALLASD
ncbi:MAG: hypothetical protein M1827_005521 [Pycnora praestabilis]|nr:MAG: hypothetical protein M1827_005521 [Pycnora praestabilis]